MKKKLFLNTFTSILFQVTTLICGFILPRMILKAYGSETNGLVSSITQFLSIVSFLEFGVGAVIQSSLYRPLAQKDNIQISQIIVSGDRFFRKIALILVGYIALLVLIYPFISTSSFDWVFTATLILAMGISSFAQYYFGIIDRLLLTADQRGYIHFVFQTATLIINTVVCIIEIKMGLSIQIVKLTTSAIYLIRPIVLRIYVNHRYKIDRKIKVTEEPIKQKWNGFAQHFASIILNDTDIIVLTLFSTLSNVSIYSVYFMVVNGVKTLFLSSTSGIQSAMGEMIAKEENEKLTSFFGGVEFAVHSSVVYIFGCTAMLILPFVSVYTSGVTDVDYYQPLFASLLVVAHASHCLRLPYNISILAAGHYKETQWNYIAAALLNIVLSIILVFFFGIVGVAIGTLVSMLFQTVWMAIYISKRIVIWPIRRFVKQIGVDIIISACIFFSTFWLNLGEISYLSWVLMALKVCGIALVVTFAVNFILYFKETKALLLSLFKKIRKES